MNQTLNITGLGGKGDGLALAGDQPIHVPYTAPGDVVTAEIDKKSRGRLVEIITPSPHRMEAPCPVFGSCGGCSVQHISADYIAKWKRDQIITALEHRGFEAPNVAQTITLPAGLRRRASLSLRRQGKKVEVGFLASKSHNLVPIEACPALHPDLSALIPALGRLAGPLMTRKGEMRARLTLTDTGIDLDLAGGREPDGRQRLALVEEVRKAKLARLTLNGDICVAVQNPVLNMGKAKVPIFPGAFLQASAEGERTLQKLVTEAAAGCQRIVDLFCGLGTLTLPLAAHAEVLAIDSHTPSLDALKSAANHVQGLKRIKVERRDLAQHPLSAIELKKYDCVVFDPPRAGAEAQVVSLGPSSISKVIGVSCNPASFARDARILCDAGYTLTRITPVDQFVWSAHIELVGEFERP